MSNYFHVLGIENTNDEKEIKRAYFRKVKEYSPEKHPEKFQEIRQAYEFLMDKEAREQYNNSIDMPEAIVNEYLEAIRLDEMENSFKAVDVLETVANAAGNNIAFLTLLGNLYYKVNKPRKAYKIFLKLVELEPDNAEFWFFLGKSQEQQKHWRKAVSSYQKAIELKPNNVNYMMFLVQILYDNSYYLEARSVVTKVLSISNTNLDAHIFAIMIAVTLGEINGGKKALKQVYRVMKSEDISGEAKTYCIAHILMFLHHFETTAYDSEKLAFKEILLTIKAVDSFQQENINAMLKELTAGELVADSTIPEYFKALTIYRIEMEDTGEIDEDEIFEVESYIIDEIKEARRKLPLFKKKYPEFYKLNKKFLDLVGNAKTVKLYEYAARKSGELDEETELLMNRPDPIVKTGPTIGRNDPCPCGSGKKYKKCCGR